MRDEDFNPLHRRRNYIYITLFNIKLCILSTHTPYRGPVGGPGEGDPSTGNFESWMKRDLEMGRLSLKGLTADGLEGVLLYWGPWVMKGRLWRRAALRGGSVG